MYTLQADTGCNIVTHFIIISLCFSTYVKPQYIVDSGKSILRHGIYLYLT